MKIENIFWNLLSEQNIPDDGQEEQPQQGQEPQQGQGPQKGQEQQQRAVQRPKQLSASQRLKVKWRQESPGLSDEDMDGAIQFFNARKNGIRAYKDPAPPEMPNQLEIVALKVRFPEMTELLSDPVKIRDIQNYTWEQIEYYMDRVSAVETSEEISYLLATGSEEEIFNSAIEKWENFPHKVLDENGILALKVESKEESMALGRLQNLLTDKYGGMPWCITYLPTPDGRTSNRWASYREDGRAFYFILDKNKEKDHQYYVSTIEPMDPHGNHRSFGPFCVTPRPNMTKSNVSWNDIVSFHKTRMPGGTEISPLEGKEHLFKYFGKTQKEMDNTDLDKINFRESTEDHPNHNDFVLQSKKVQQRYVESPSRQINNKRAFMVLTADLRFAYVRATTRDNYLHRYKCDDPNDPFGILNIIAQDRQLFRTLDVAKLQNELHIPEGVIAIQKSILKLGLNESLADKDKKLVLFGQKDGGPYFGVMNMSTIQWEKPMSYIKSEPLSLFRMEKGKMIRSRIRRYTLAGNGGDWFYFLYEGDSLTNPKSPNYLIGKYFSKEDGDNFIKNLSEYGYRSFTKS